MKELNSGAPTSEASFLLNFLGRRAAGVSPAGVTVESSSEALIEKVRSAVTDTTGQYQIVDLRPGSYTLTFSLPGFRTVRRENIEVRGAGTITIDADLSVGAAFNGGGVSGNAYDSSNAQEMQILRVGRTRTDVAIDLLNLFNASTGTAFQQNYGDGSQFMRPLTILNPRFVRFNVTFDF